MASRFPGMVFAMGFLQFADGEVKVTLGGGKAAVAEHFLDMAEIGFALQKVRGATVPPQVACCLKSFDTWGGWQAEAGYGR